MLRVFVFQTDSELVVLITGVLVVTTLLPMIPQPSRHLLDELFDVFGRLAGWTHRSSGTRPDRIWIWVRTIHCCRHH